MRSILLPLTTLTVVLACSTEPSSHGDPCEARAEGQGVKIVIRSSSCDYDRGAPATFDYEITTDDSVPTIHVAASMGCGSCRQPSPELNAWSSWIIAGTSASGTTQQYCRCDTGCCAPDLEADVKPRASTLKDSISWSGRVWQGPSDTSTPEGDFFQPGNYEVKVSFAGLATAKLPIVVRDE